MSFCSQKYEIIQGQLASHIKKRQKIRQKLRNKGIQMLDRPQQLLQDIQEPQLHPSLSNIQNTLKNELSQKGYINFRYLGKGAQGLVILAKEKQTNKRYAIKGIHVRDSQGNNNEEILNQAKKEIDMLKKFKGSPYVVMYQNKFLKQIN